MKHRVVSGAVALFMALSLALPVSGEETQQTTAPQETQATIPQTQPKQPTPTETVPVPTETQPPSTESPTEPPTEPEELQTSDALEIDSQFIYPGMDMPYADGYVPRVEEGIVYLMLPLLANRQISGNRIQASLELGNSPAFVAASYQKDFYLSQFLPENGSLSRELFLVEFPVELSPERSNGIYPVSIHISGYTDAGEAIAFTHTLYVTITDGVSKEPVKTTVPPVSTPTAEPVVYISQCIMEPNPILAGEPFTLTVTLKNLLKTKSVKNLLVTVEPGDMQINLLENSNVIPVDTIGPEEEAVLQLAMQADPSISPGKYTVQFSFSYNSSQTLNLSSKGSCVLDIRQPAELSYDGARLPANVYQGEVTVLSVNLMNTGKTTLYNCRMETKIPGLDAGGITFVGQIDPGKSADGKINLLVSKEEIGQVKGKILLLYEDSFGTEYRQEAEVTTQIEEMILPTDPEEKKEEKENSLWWLFGLLGIAAGASLGVGIPWYIQQRRQRKEDDLRL